MTPESHVLPDDRRYDEHHQWARREQGVVRCGLTEYQTEAAGDMVFVGLPTVGSRVTRGEEIGSVESGKWVSSLFAPADGVVAAVNSALVDDPALVNRSPYEEGWVFAVETAEEVGGLSAEEYVAVIREEEAAGATRIRERSS